MGPDSVVFIVELILSAALMFLAVYYVSLHTRWGPHLKTISFLAGFCRLFVSQT
jgi:hypothetical protein